MIYSASRALFDKINSEIYEAGPDGILDVFEDYGAIIDDECEMVAPGPVEREDIEAKFDSEIEGNYCTINLVDEKEDPVIVNPETAGTIGVVALLLVISSSIIFYSRKVKNN